MCDRHKPDRVSEYEMANSWPHRIIYFTPNFQNMHWNLIICYDQLKIMIEQNERKRQKSKKIIESNLAFYRIIYGKLTSFFF